MGKQKVAPAEESQPVVKWLLKPRRELAAVARWFCCHTGHHAAPSTPQDVPVDRQSDTAPCRLCPGFAGRSRSDVECWRATEADVLEWLNDVLARTFPDRAMVVVVDWLRSFTAPYDRPIFRVEATSEGSSAPEAYIVKVALGDEFGPGTTPAKGEQISARLERESAGYRYIHAQGLNKASPVFARLDEGYRKNGSLLSLKYSDAEQTLRAGDAVYTLEESLLDACNGGQRFFDSVESTIVHLFAELEDVWYRHAQPRERKAMHADYFQRRLGPGRRKWLDSDTEAGRARDEVLWALRDQDIEFLDPALYFNPDCWPQAPEMLVGTAHGDLHARNVLVGVVEGESGWPIVFDYEDVVCCNPVGWDFVKLETELKKSAFSDPVFLKAGSDNELIHRLFEYELELNKRTEFCYNHNSWAERVPGINGTPPAERLAHAILTVRRMAWKCLELRRGRSRKWLHEYYFLLAAYGVYAARFAARREVRPLKTLFISAGIAAFRHAYGEDLGQRKVALRKCDAWDAIANACSGIQSPEVAADARDPGGSDAAHSEPSAAAGSPNDAVAASIRVWKPGDVDIHRGNLMYAKQLARSRQRACLDQAIRLLRQIMNDHPFVLEPAYECVFAILELAQLTRAQRQKSPTQLDASQEEVEGDSKCRELWSEADRLLKRADAQFRRQMHHELLSRRGRLCKDQADAQLADGHLERAEVLYKQAAVAYENAAKVSDPSEKYYPGINAATCFWLSHENNRGQAEQQAEAVLKWVKIEEEKLTTPEIMEKDDARRSLMWVLASKGEALVVRGLSADNNGRKWLDAARTAYVAALDIAKREGELKQQSETMLQQLERIRVVAVQRGLKAGEETLNPLIATLQETARA